MRNLKKRLLAYLCALTVCTGLLPAGNTLTTIRAEAADVVSIDDDAQFTEAYSKAIAFELGKAKEALNTFASAANVWNIIGLARSGQMTQEVKDQFILNMRETINTAKGVADAKTIIALAAMGAEVTDFEGYNLIESLADFDTVTGYGFTNAAYALIALNTRNYDIPDISAGTGTQTMREKLINYLLDCQLADGGWSWGDTIDPDSTGTVIQALSPYVDDIDDVKTAIEKSLTALSGVQLENGGFKNADSEWGGVLYPGEFNCESTAQVWCALTSLNIDISDSRFVKGDNTVKDALLSFQLADGSFSHLPNGESDYSFATPQAFYTMAAYGRMKNGETALYDMTDVAVDVPSKIDSQTEVTVKKQKILSAKSTKKKQITVKYTKMSNASSYQLQYSTSNKFAKKKTNTISTEKTTYTIKKLKNKKTYYIRVRTCQQADGKNYYGSYSKVVKVRVK